MLPLGEQAAEAFRFGQMLDGDVLRRLFALRLELLSLAVQGLDGFSQARLFLL
jgi:hypothetical protein